MQLSHFFWWSVSMQGQTKSFLTNLMSYHFSPKKTSYPIILKAEARIRWAFMFVWEHFLFYLMWICRKQIFKEECDSLSVIPDSTLISVFRIMFLKQCRFVQKLCSKIIFSSFTFRKCHSKVYLLCSKRLRWDSHQISTGKIQT